MHFPEAASNLNGHQNGLEGSARELPVAGLGEDAPVVRDALSQLACSLHRLSSEDHIVIDRKRNEVIRTNAVTQQMTIFRCLDPVGMGMRMEPHAQPLPTPPPTAAPYKVGRPAKRSVPATKTPREAHGAPETCPTGMPAPIVHRTRSGRQVRGGMAQPAPVATIPAVEPSSTQMLELLVADLRDKDYRAAMPAPRSSPEQAALPPPASQGRTVPKGAICPGCNKIFLGRRLQRHFVKFPEHMTRSAAPETAAPTLFALLTAQLQRHSHLSEEQRADLFLHELNDFVEQLQVRSQRLIRNTSGLHFVNARIARVLAIPEGQYALDMSAMESAQAPTPEPEAAALVHVGSGGVGGGVGARNLVDYTGLSMSLDDTLTDEAAQRLNLSAGGKLLPPSEESLLRNVSDLMQPPVAPSTVNHGYDHASDNAVEALTMKETPSAEAILNVDFFQFNPN